MIKNFGSQNYTRWIYVIYHHIQKLADDKNLRIVELQNLFILADRLTKTILVDLFGKY